MNRLSVAILYGRAGCLRITAKHGGCWRGQAWYTGRILGGGAVPLTMGGDHTLALPVLRAMASKYGHGKVSNSLSGYNRNEVVRRGT